MKILCAWLRIFVRSLFSFYTSILRCVCMKLLFMLVHLHHGYIFFLVNTKLLPLEQFRLKVATLSELLAIVLMKVGLFRH